MGEVLLSERHGAVTVLTMNRPEVRNALDDTLMLALREALAVCETDGTRCIVLTGAGGAFSSGADIKKAFVMGLTPDRAYQALTETYAPTLKAVRGASWPVIAAVDGYAAGIGCDLALACDIRLASEKAIFAELFVRVGLIPDGGGTYLLPRIIGLGRALEMLYTGMEVDAQEAYRIGLANRVFSGDFLAQVMDYAVRIAAQSPHSLRRSKAAVRDSLDSTYADALAREAEHQRAIFAEPDGMDGFRAFLERRKG